jgi:alkyl hydroperoxide reductase subunit AhpC
MQKLVLLFFAFSFSFEANYAQETKVKIKQEGTLPKNEFIQTNFAGQGYQSSESMEGVLSAELSNPKQISFLHLKNNGKILGERSFWVGEGNYSITGNVTDLSSWSIDPIHSYTKISEQIKSSEGSVQKELILENLDKEVGVIWLVSKSDLFSPEELATVIASIPSELQELNFLKRFQADLLLTESWEPVEGGLSRDFKLESSEGSEIAFSDYDGKYRLLEFSFTGCKPCIEALPEIKEIHERFGDELTVISIWDDRSKDTWLNTAKNHKEIITWTDLWDEAGYVTKLYQINVWPTYILISPEGTIQQIWNSYYKGKILRKMENLFGYPNP